ncbi:alanine racemase [Microvirga flavescens]|uniref:alanine racemase n=1 Tax=Microvirga flavescens TaxID=2249811 RepID=UPI000DD55B8E|nr:alanine racemase [Microvirga flavescens]
MQGSQTGLIPDAEAGAVLTIDLDAIAANWRTLRERAGTDTAAVVKADAYGTGIEKTVPALLDAGCRVFFVAHLSEAKRVRAVATEATIYVLNGFPHGTGPTYANHDIRPVLGSLEEIEEWAAFCRSQGARLPAAIHVDTGMHRLGLPLVEGLSLSNDARIKDFDLALLMSHLVSAEEPENQINARQIAAFTALRGAMPGIPCSLANSSGTFLKGMQAFELARPGYALYGGNPTPHLSNPMKPVAHLDARVIQLRYALAGETAGYNAAWTAPSRRRLATISVGYADGYPRSAGSTNTNVGDAGIAIVAGRRCPFVGRVSMDLIIIDVTDVPEHEIHRGDIVTLIGTNLTIDEVGRRAGTIGYEILTSLGRRYARHYRGGPR